MAIGKNEYYMTGAPQVVLITSLAVYFLASFVQVRQVIGLFELVVLLNFHYISFPFLKICRLEKGHIVPVLCSYS